MNTFIDNLQNIPRAIEMERAALLEMMREFSVFVYKTQEDVIGSSLSVSNKSLALQAIHVAEDIAEKHVFPKVFFKDVYPLLSEEKNTLNVAQLPSILSSLNYGLKGASDELFEKLNSILFRHQNGLLDNPDEHEVIKETRSLDEIVREHVQGYEIFDYSISEDNAFNEMRKGVRHIVIESIGSEFNKRGKSDLSRVEKLLDLYDTFNQDMVFGGLSIKMGTSKMKPSELIEDVFAKVVMNNRDANLPIKELSQLTQKILDAVDAGTQAGVNTELSR